MTLRKYLVTFIAILTVLMALTSCEIEQAKGIEHPTTLGEGQDPAAVYGLTMTVENVTPIGATLLMTRAGGEAIADEVITGRPFGLEQLVNGEWIPLEMKGEATFTTEGIFLLPDDTVRMSVNWDHIYGSLSAGQYRLHKSVAGLGAENESRIAFDCYAYFEIPQ